MDRTRPAKQNNPWNGLKNLGIAKSLIDRPFIAFVPSCTWVPRAPRRHLLTTLKVSRQDERCRQKRKEA